MPAKLPEHGDRALALRLFKEHERLARVMAADALKRFPSSVPFADIHAELLTALWWCARHFDPKRVRSFERWAVSQLLWRARDLVRPRRKSREVELDAVVRRPKRDEAETVADIAEERHGREDQTDTLANDHLRSRLFQLRALIDKHPGLTAAERQDLRAGKFNESGIKKLSVALGVKTSKRNNGAWRNHLRWHVKRNNHDTRRRKGRVFSCPFCAP